MTQDLPEQLRRRKPGPRVLEFTGFRDPRLAAVVPSIEKSGLR